MYKNMSVKIATALSLLVFCLPAVLKPMAIYGQGGESVSQLEKKVDELMDQVKYTEALPLLEKLLIAEPNNPKTHFNLGFALLGLF